MHHISRFFKYCLPLILLALITLSCNNERLLYHYSKDIDEDGWKHSDSLVFEIESIDTTKIFDINVNIRNNNYYPYANLGIVFLIQEADSVVYSDTLNLVMSYNNGMWRGNGWGSLYEFKTNLIKDYNFENKGVYRLILLQYMDVNPLTGLNSLGIEMEEIED